MKQTAVLLYPKFSEYEISVALSALAQAGRGIVTISDSLDPVVGEAGLTCLPDAAYADVAAEDFDSVLLPGMMQVLPQGPEERCVSFLREMAEHGAVVGAISLAPYLLAKAGLLEGKFYTVGMYEEDMDEMGVFDKEMLVKEAVVVDSGVITAVGAGFAQFGIAFARAVGGVFDETWYGVE